MPRPDLSIVITGMVTGGQLAGWLERSGLTPAERATLDILMVEPAVSEGWAPPNSLPEGVRAVVAERPGAAAAFNAGVSAARHGLVLRIAPGVMPLTADWILPLLAAHEERPDAGAVGVVWRGADGRIASAGRRFVSGLGLRSARAHIGAGENDLGQYAALDPVDAVNGDLALYRRTALADVGGLDDSYLTPGLCDDDLGVALWTKGYAVLRCGAVEAGSLQAVRPPDYDAEDLSYWRDRWGWDPVYPDLQAVRRLWGRTPLCRDLGMTPAGSDAILRDAEERGAAPAVDILIPTFNSVAWLERCLDALAGTDYPNARLTVLDNGSTDGTPAFLESYARRAGLPFAFRAIRLPVNVGYPAGMNWLLAVTDAPIVARCDDDIVVPPEWLAYLVDTLRRHPHAGAVAPRVLNHGQPGILQFGDIRIWPVNNYHHLIPDEGQCDHRTRTTHACGACVVYRRRVFETAGGYDIGFSPSQLDDLDHFVAVRHAGFDVLYDGGVAIQHKINNGADPSPKARASHAANFQRLIGKWGGDAFEILESALDRGGRRETYPLREAAER